MKRKTTISGVDIVSLPSDVGKGGKNLDPSVGSSGQGNASSEPNMGGSGERPASPGTQSKPTPKKGPGRRTLSPEEKLNDDYLERIRKKIDQAVAGQGAEWNIGGIPVRPGQGKPGETSNGPSIGMPVEAPPGGDERIWVDIETLEKEIDEAIRRGDENERMAEDDEGKAEMTDSKKTTGGKGKGRGRVRDRIAVERLSQVDWAAIFKSRLTAYSKENSKYLPWNRRFVAQPTTLGRKIGSKTPQKDVLPELNLIVDTSGSISFGESSVVMGEIEKAVSAAQIKLVNVFLWHNTAYAYKEFKDVSAKNFAKIIDWVNSNWETGGNDEIAIYSEVIKKGKAKKFTISITDAYLENHMVPGKLYDTWTKALDPANLIFAVIYPNKSIPYSDWTKLADRMPGQKVPVFFDRTRFRNK